MKNLFKFLLVAFFGFCLLLNSCSKESNEDNQGVLISDKLSLTRTDFSEISLKAISKTNDNNTPVFLSNESTAIVDITAINSLDNFNHLISFSCVYDLNISETIDSQANLLQTFYIDENIVLQTYSQIFLKPNLFLVHKASQMLTILKFLVLQIQNL